MRAALCVIVIVAACAGEIEEDSKAGDGLVELAYEDNGADTDDSGEPRARVCAEGATTKGIDVSKWQGTINWPAVKQGGVAFAFIRLSDGANYKDPKFATFNNVVKKGPDGNMLLERRPIPDMRADLKQIVEENK